MAGTMLDDGPGRMMGVEISLIGRTPGVFDVTGGVLLVLVSGEEDGQVTGGRGFSSVRGDSIPRLETMCYSYVRVLLQQCSDMATS
jgi:hypothetical protein